MWWQDAVVYQIYPRSFQDSDGDGIGDLRGIEQRLDHLKHLGVDALWLSPIYPSPLADFGYDVSDYTHVDPTYGSLEDFDRLLGAAHDRDLKLLMDLVPCHTSIEHPWFREHPDWYIQRDGDRPPNNWVATFGGPAWHRHPETGRWYLHTYYPEQPDLDWRSPEVREAMQRVIRFWLERGVDGFRLDAIHALVKDEQLRDDPPAGSPFALPLPPEYAKLEHLYSLNAPDIHVALEALREAAGDALLVGEVYLPSAQLAPYLDHVDMVFGFELFHSPWRADTLRAAIEAGASVRRGEGPGAAWVVSNHDFARLPTRFGAENVRPAAMLLLTLPGTAFIYQGDEIGLDNGPGADPPYDRAGRDAARHPMQWDASAHGGFTSGEPWLPPVDPQERNVEAQRGDPSSLLSFYRALIALRPKLGREFELLDAPAGVLAYRRGEHLVTFNLTSEEQPLLALDELVLSSDPAADLSTGRLPAHTAAIGRPKR
jgi:alpha-glucosidase